MIISTDKTFDGLEISYEIFDDGYEIYLDSVSWIGQREPNIPYPNLSYEENCLKQIDNLMEIQTTITDLNKKIDDVSAKLTEEFETALGKIEDCNVTNTLNTTTKAYLTGTTSATTNTGTQIFDTGVYLGATAGSLYSNIVCASSGLRTINGDIIYSNMYISNAGSTSTVGESIISAGNNVASGTAHNARGRIRLFGTGTGFIDIIPSNTSSSYTVTLPYTNATLLSTAFASGLTTNVTFNDSGTSFRGIIGNVADSDTWRVGGGATASEAGYLELATADDGTEPIYVRQYTDSTFSTSKRTLTLLNSDGNTNFPGAANSYSSEGFAVLDSNDIPYSSLKIKNIGTTSDNGIGTIIAGNSLISGTAGNARGEIRLYGTGVYYTGIVTGNNDASDGSNKTVTIPNYTGNVLLSSYAYMDSDIFFNSNDEDVTAFRGIRGYMGGNDRWRIGGMGYGSDSGYIEIATADNGNESIRVRQYSDSSFSTIVRTLVLLDGDGNSIFPGDLTSRGATGINVTDSNNYEYARLWKHTTGTASTVGIGFLIAGNPTVSGTAGNSRGALRLYGSSSGYTNVTPANDTNVYSISLPAANGTLALNTVMGAATSSAAGTSGLVPAPDSGKQTSFLRGDGTWVVPTNTDTHYTTHLITGASATATANAAATNGNVWLNILDNTTIRNTHNIVGTGATTVVSDANGKITINSTNTVYTHPTSGVTAGTYGPTAALTLSWGGTFNVPYATVNATGHVTAMGNRVITMPANPNTDTKVTNTLNTTAKAYLTGTTSATTNTGTQVFDTGVYLGTTAGSLYSNILHATSSVQLLNDNIVCGIMYITVKGTTSVVGSTLIEIGNNIASSTAGNARGRLRLYGIGTAFTDIMTTNNSTTDNYITIPNASGTLALDTVMGGATSSTAGTSGLVPAPAAGKQASFLRGDGTWAVPTDTDTKVTNTLNTTAKAYLTGTTSATTNTGTQIFDTDVYLGATAGSLYATSLSAADVFVSNSIQYVSNNVPYYNLYVSAKGTTTVTGEAVLQAGNSTASGTANNARGRIRLYGTNAGYTDIITGNEGTTSGTVTIPSSGTLLSSTWSYMGSTLYFNNITTGFRGISGTIGSNDVWRVGGGATASDAGYLELATGNEGTEPIYVRQYTDSSFASTGLVRTLTLLNSEGNSTFPGNFTTRGYAINVRDSNNYEYASIWKHTAGTTSTDGIGILKAGNDTASGTAGNARGILQLYGTNTGYTNLRPANDTNAYLINLPAANGTLLSTAFASGLTTNVTFSDSGTTFRGITGTVGGADTWRVGGSAFADGAGYLEIATAYHTIEPIYVRQYSDTSFSTVSRTATLLDGSGNTQFPGTVSTNGIEVCSSSGATYASLNIDVEGTGGDSPLGLGVISLTIGNDMSYSDIDNATGGIIIYGWRKGATIIGPTNNSSSDVNILLPSSDGTLALTDPMVGATSSSFGASGLVPEPAPGDQSSFLRGDGEWATPATTTVVNNLTSTSTSSALSANQGRVLNSSINSIISSLNGMSYDKVYIIGPVSVSSATTTLATVDLTMGTSITITGTYTISSSGGGGTIVVYNSSGSQTLFNKTGSNLTGSISISNVTLNSDMRQSNTSIITTGANMVFSNMSMVINFTLSI